MEIGFIGQGISVSSESGSQFVTEANADIDDVSRVGTVVYDSIKDEQFETVRIFSAFARASAVEQLQKVLSQSSTPSLEIVVGIDHQNTPKEALEALAELPADVRVFQRNAITYHPKIYYFAGSEATRLVVGSSNLTDAGLNRNVESAIIVETANHDADIVADALEFTTQIWESADPLSEALIDALMKQGQIASSSQQKPTDDKQDSGVDGETEQPPILDDFGADTPIQGLSPVVPSGPGADESEVRQATTTNDLPPRSEMPPIPSADEFDTKTDKDYYRQLINDQSNQPSLIRRYVRAHGEVAMTDLERIASEDWGYSLSGSFGASIHILTDVTDEVRRESRRGETYFIWTGE